MRIFNFADDSAIARGIRALAMGIAGVAALPLASAAEPQHALAMYGEPALPSGFSALPYVDPNAPKGGTIRLAEAGGFDSLKRWVLKGTPVWTVADFVVEPLMYRSLDEPFTLYCLLCETVDTPPDRSWVEFTLRPEARFSDGNPVTVDDVIWSFEMLGTKGHPRYAGAWKKVASITQTGPRSLRITFNTADRELPLLMGMRPVLEKARGQGKDFAASSLEPVIGSGPYVIESVDPGRAITYRRNPDYWGRNLPLMRGLNNFDRIRVDYFADANAMFEAFKGGEIDVWRELNGARWLRDFDFPALRQGRVVKLEIPHRRPSGIVGLVMNTRSPLFADWRVREAMTLAFNFPFINRTLGAGSDPRITSYFSNSDLAMRPGPVSGAEAALLAPFAGSLPPGTIEGTALPAGADQPLDRPALRRAMALLADAGWTVQDGVLKNTRGEPFAPEIVLNQSGSAMRAASEIQQIVNIYVQALKPLGIAPRVTVFDSAQYVERTNQFRFDVAWYERGLTLSPGNEQALYWGSASAAQTGSKNWAGVASPAVDAMIGAMLSAATPEDFTAAVRAMDRLLSQGRYVIPASFSPVSRVAVSSRLKRPDTVPIYGDWPGYLPDTWWDGAAK